MKEQVLFIAPFKKLAEDAYLVIEERFSDKKDLFKVVEADLVEAEEVVKKYINDGIEVIVSRGGTASLLEKEVDIPMVYIQVTITDILQSLLELKKMPDNIGIAGFENMIYGVEEIAKILNTNFVEILISKAEEADMKINRAINRGIDFIVGDAISVKLAKKYGINGKFINSGKESIYRALQEALLIAKVRRQDEHKSEMIRTIIQKSHDGIIATNEENRRWAPLGAAVVLLVFCGWRVMSMGVEMLPTITSNEAIVTLSTEKDMTKEESYAVAENVIDALLAVDNVEEVGVTTDSRVAGMDVGQLGLPQTITDLLNAANSYGTYQINVMLDESLSSRQIEQAREALEEAVNGVENCTATVEISGMQELTSQLDMGLTVQISGNDIDTMTVLSEKVVDMVNEMDGFTNATNGLGSGDATINLQIDRDKVRSYGLTVAQVYQQIAAKLTTTTTAQTPVAIDGSTMNVQISNNLDPMTKENMMDMTFTTSVMAADGTTQTGTCTLGDMATWVTGSTPDSITSKNQTRYISVTADAVEGTNTTTETRALEKKLNAFAASDEMPEGCSFYMGGGSEINGMVVDQMGQWMFLALPFVYLVMVAQFQSLLSPFIVLFTIPLAFTGGLLGLLLTGQQLTMISLMGFIVLMGTVVNNGIVFVDYANQLRIGGMERRAALIATGKTRMRPILMTTLTTVLAMLQLVFSGDMASQLMSGMAIVIIFGLTYATLMTLYVVPLMYDILFKKPPLNVDIGDENLDDIPDDAAEYIAQNTAQPE